MTTITYFRKPGKKSII